MHVPEGWDTGHVKDLLAGLNSGVSVNGEDTPANRFETGVLKVSSVSYGVFLPYENKRVIEEELNLVKESPRKGSILISRSNTEALVGASVYIHKDYTNLFLPDKLWQTIPRKGKNVDLKWLFYFLSSEPTRYRLSKLATGTSGSMKNITKDELLTLSIKIPPFSEQQKIAKILSTWDKAIEKLEALIAAKKKRKKALMQQLLTGKKRFAGFEGEWKKISLKNVMRVRKELSLPTEANPLYSLTIESGVTEKTDRYNREFLVKDNDNKKYKLVYPNDIVYNPANLRWGAINISRINHKVVVSPIYEVLYIKNISEYCHLFISHLLMSPRQVAIFACMAEGTLVERMAVKIETFLATSISIPSSIVEQQKIASVLTAADKEIETHQKQLAALKEQKKGLMQQLLTGKKRVKLDEPELLAETVEA